MVNLSRTRETVRSGGWGLVVGSAVLVLAILTAYPWHRSLLLISVSSIAGLVLLAFYALTGSTARGRNGRRSLLFALGVGLSYPLAEWILFRFVDVAAYAAMDWPVLDTPLFVLLLWVYSILLVAIIASELLVRFLPKRWVLGLLTGFLVALVGPAFETVGNLMGLWSNIPSAFTLGYVPLYVFLGYFFTFVLLPYALERPVLGGIAISGLLTLEWMIFHRLLLFLNRS